MQQSGRHSSFQRLRSRDPSGALRPFRRARQVRTAVLGTVSLACLLPGASLSRKSAEEFSGSSVACDDVLNGTRAGDSCVLKTF